MNLLPIYMPILFIRFNAIYAIEYVSLKCLLIFLCSFRSATHTLDAEMNTKTWRQRERDREKTGEVDWTLEQIDSFVIGGWATHQPKNILRPNMNIFFVETRNALANIAKFTNFIFELEGDQHNVRQLCPIEPTWIVFPVLWMKLSTWAAECWATSATSNDD